MSKMHTFEFDINGYGAGPQKITVAAPGKDRVDAHANAAAMIRRDWSMPANVSLLGRLVTPEIGTAVPPSEIERARHLARAR